jgi:hypothetical protein
MKIAWDLETARQARHLAEDRHEDLVSEMLDAIKSSITAHNRREASLGCDVATPDEETMALAEAAWSLVQGGIGVERFADLLRLVPSEDFQHLLQVEMPTLNTGGTQ